MDAIFNKNGTVVAWLCGSDILDLSGTYRAFVNGSSVIGYQNGRHLGWFEQGALWDSQNRAIGMTHDVSASIPRPGLSGVPGSPAIGGRPGRPGIPGTPRKPGRSGGWSTQEWNDWMPSKQQSRLAVPRSLCLSSKEVGTTMTTNALESNSTHPQTSTADSLA